MTQTTNNTYTTPDTDQPFHFYASNAGMWATTTEDRDLRALISLMEADGMFYALYYVPLPENADYKIRWYAPQVPGAIHMGSFEPKAKAKAKARAFKTNNTSPTA